MIFLLVLYFRVQLHIFPIFINIWMESSFLVLTDIHIDVNHFILFIHLLLSLLQYLAGLSSYFIPAALIGHVCEPASSLQI